MIYNYNFKFDDGNVLVNSENAEFIFNKMELLKILIHGGNDFKVEENFLVDGFFETEKVKYYIEKSDEFINLINCILGISDLTDLVITNCIRLGGSKYLEDKYRNNKEIFKKIEYMKSIVDPACDSEDMFDWIQLSCMNRADFCNEQKKMTQKGYIIVSSVDMSSDKENNSLNIYNFRKNKVK